MINYTLKQIAQLTNGQLIGEENAKICGVGFDSRIMQPGQLFVPIKGEKVDGHSFVADLFVSKGIGASLWSKDCKLEKPQGNLIIVDDVQTAFQKLAISYRKQLNCHFIGITGSSGKTSTKDIVASVVASRYKTYKTQGNQNNDLGVPLTICNMDESVEYAVLEMGINDFGVMDRLVSMVEPEITVITSIGPAHIAQLKTLDNIVEQKCLINRDLANGQCFYNHEAYGLEKQLEKMHLENKAISYGFDQQADMVGYDYCLNDFGTSFAYKGKEFHLPILGKHQVLNGLAAIGVGHYLNLSDEEIQRGLEAVQLTPHRLQLKNINDAIIIDDTYNANPSSLVASLQMICQYNHDYHKVVVLGDMLELGETSGQLHYDIASEVDFHNFDAIYLIGQEMSNLKKHLDQQHIASTYYQNNAMIVEELRTHCLAGNVIFFKASNGMKLASVINALEESYD